MYDKRVQYRQLVLLSLFQNLDAIGFHRNPQLFGKGGLGWLDMVIIFSSATNSVLNYIIIIMDGSLELSTNAIGWAFLTTTT